MLPDKDKLICCTEDDFTEEKRLEDTRWLAVLSDGRTVIQDDGREGTDEPAWVRLRNYLSDKPIRIEELIIQFRSRKLSPLPKGADGYYFANAVFADAFRKRSVTQRLFIVGAMEGDKLTVAGFIVPALIPAFVETRDIDTAGERLIVNGTRSLHVDDKREESSSA